jgi:hypothetical protein
MTNTPPDWRRFRFSLQTVLVLILLAGVVVEITKSWWMFSDKRDQAGRGFAFAELRVQYQPHEASGTFSAVVTHHGPKAVFSDHPPRPDLSAGDLRLLNEMTSVRELDLSRCDITDQQLARLDLPLLESMAARVHGDDLSQDATIEQLVRFPKLKHIRIDDDRLRGHNAALLKQLANLESLHLWGPIDAAGVRQIATLTQLKHLSLRGADLTQDGLTALAALTQLETLNLDECQVANSQLQQLAACRNLETLSLMEASLNDEGVAGVAAIPRLTNLQLNGTALTGRGLKALANCRGLSRLNLFNCDQLKPDALCIFQNRETPLIILVNGDLTDADVLSDANLTIE